MNFYLLDLNFQPEENNVFGASMKLISLSECNATFHCEIGEGQICARLYRSEKCRGTKSGGPLQFIPYKSNIPNVVGISSYDGGCGTAKPNIYTNIAYFLNWIESIVWPDISLEL